MVLKISTGSETLGCSMRAERLHELAYLVGADNITDILLAVSKDKFADVRMEAAKIMGSSKQIDSRINNTLDSMLDDVLPFVRAIAGAALSNRNAFPKERDSVIIKLALGTDAANWNMEGFMPKAEYAKEKQNELNNLNNKGSNNTSVLQNIRVSIRRNAMGSLRPVGTKKCLDALQTLKRDADPNIRNTAKTILDSVAVITN